MKSTKQILEQSKRISSILANVIDPVTHERSERYYFVLRIYQEAKVKINAELDVLRFKKENQIKKTIGELRAMVIEERRAIKEAGFTFPLREI